MSGQEWALLCPAKIGMLPSSGQYKEGFLKGCTKISYKPKAENYIWV